MLTGNCFLILLTGNSCMIFVQRYRQAPLWVMIAFGDTSNRHWIARLDSPGAGDLTMLPIKGTDPFTPEILALFSGQAVDIDGQCRAGRYTCTAAVTQHLFKDRNRFISNLRAEADRFGRTGLSAFITFRTPVCEAGIGDKGSQVPGMTIRWMQAARFACQRAFAAKSAAAFGKINLRVITSTIDENTLRAGIDTLATMITRLDKRLLCDRPGRTERCIARNKLVAQQMEFLGNQVHSYYPCIPCRLHTLCIPVFTPDIEPYQIKPSLFFEPISMQVVKKGY